jgi:hypothetical protein
MPIDKENIKKALDAFEADDFTTSKEILQKEISGRKAEWMQEKLGLEKPIGEDSSTSYAPPAKKDKKKDEKDEKDEE